MAINIENIITAEDLGEPYDILACKIGIAATFKFANKFHGRELRFNKNTYKERLEEIKKISDEKTADRIIKAYWGEKVYFPKIRKVCKEKIDTAIKNNFNGNNHTELAEIFDYSVRHIYRILGNKSSKKVINECQLTLFDKL